MDHKQLFNKYLVFTFTFLVLLLEACDPPQPNETDKFERELETFNNKMGTIDQTLELLDAMQKEMDYIEEQRALGQISETVYNLRMNEIRETYGRAVARKENVNPARSLPIWARELGLIEPENLQLDPDYSQMTLESNTDEGFNSVLLVYTGDYDVAMQEAGRIARSARIPMSKDYLQAMELSKTYGSTMKGVAYMNFDPFVKDAVFNISITVDETGMLTISAVDVAKMKQQFDNTPAE